MAAEVFGFVGAEESYDGASVVDACDGLVIVDWNIFLDQFCNLLEKGSIPALEDRVPALIRILILHPIGRHLIDQTRLIILSLANIIIERA